MSWPTSASPIDAWLANCSNHPRGIPSRRLGAVVQGDAALAGADEGDEVGDLGDVAQLLLEARQGAGQDQVAAVQEVEGLADGIDGGVRDARPPHADDVDPADHVEPLHD